MGFELLEIFYRAGGFPPVRRIGGLFESRKIAKRFLVELPQRPGAIENLARPIPWGLPLLLSASSEKTLRLAHPQNVLHEMRPKPTNTLRCNRDRTLVQEIHLHHTALTNKACMSMPGMVGATKSEEGAA